MSSGKGGMMEHTEGRLEVKHREPEEYAGGEMYGTPYLYSVGARRYIAEVNSSHMNENKEANAERIKDLWNAAPEDTKQAVVYLEHGAEMESEIKSLLAWLEPYVKGHNMARMVEVDGADIRRLKALLSNLEVK